MTDTPDTLDTLDTLDTPAAFKPANPETFMDAMRVLNPDEQARRERHHRRASNVKQAPGAWAGHGLNRRSGDMTSAEYWSTR